MTRYGCCPDCGSQEWMLILCYDSDCRIEGLECKHCEKVIDFEEEVEIESSILNDEA